VFLGRGRYERRGEDALPGHRNGWQPPAPVKTTMGPVELQRPKLRRTDEEFCSRLFGTGVSRTNALEALVISGWVRGLSDRDVEAALAEALGPETALSRVPGPAELAALRQDIDRALRDGALPERKAVMQAVVAEIRVRDRGHIQPVFRVPVFGPPYGSVPPAGIEPAHAV
jgi:hypothetical protein